MTLKKGCIWFCLWFFFELIDVLSKRLKDETSEFPLQLTRDPLCHCVTCNLIFEQLFPNGINAFIFPFKIYWYFFFVKVWYLYKWIICLHRNARALEFKEKSEIFSKHATVSTDFGDLVISLSANGLG